MPFCNCSLLFASRCLVLFWQSTGSFSHDLNFTVSITNTSSVHVEIIVVNVAIRKFPLNKKAYYMHSHATEELLIMGVSEYKLIRNPLNLMLHN